MKKNIIYLLLVVLLSIAPLSAQDNENADSTYYIKTVFLIKVALHKDGYLVRYVKDNGKLADACIPFEWFDDKKESMNRSEIYYGNSASYPYITIIYKDGEVSKVRLYVMKNMTDLSWDRFNHNKAYTDEFNKMKDAPSFEL